MKSNWNWLLTDGGRVKGRIALQPVLVRFLAGAMPMDLPPLDPDLYRKLREDIRFQGIQVPILVDSLTGEVIDGRQRKRIAAELKIKAIPTIHVGRLTEGERADLQLAVNLYRRHLSRPQIREIIAWSLRERPETSDRSLADGCGVDHKTVGGVRRRLESTGESPIRRWTRHSWRFQDCKSGEASLALNSRLLSQRRQ